MVVDFVSVPSVIGDVRRRMKNQKGNGQRLKFLRHFLVGWLVGRVFRMKQKTVGRREGGREINERDVERINDPSRHVIRPVVYNRSIIL